MAEEKKIIRERLSLVRWIFWFEPIFPVFGFSFAQSYIYIGLGLVGHI